MYTSRVRIFANYEEMIDEIKQRAAADTSGLVVLQRYRHRKIIAHRLSDIAVADSSKNYQLGFPNGAVVYLVYVGHLRDIAFESMDWVIADGHTLITTQELWRYVKDGG